MFWRRKRKPVVVAPEPREEPLGVPYWVDRLATRLARLHRLRELRAPENILDAEQRLVGDAIATLTPVEALSVRPPRRSSGVTRQFGPANGRFLGGSYEPSSHDSGSRW